MLTGLTTVGIWVAAIGLIGIFIRQIGPWRKQDSEAQAHFRDDLINRVSRLEKQLDLERSRRELDQRLHEAERAADRHKLKNITQCFDMLLELIEMSPERAQEIVTKIKAKRAEQEKLESEEATAIRAAKIEAETKLTLEINSGEEELG